MDSKFGELKSNSIKLLLIGFGYRLTRCFVFWINVFCGANSIFNTRYSGYKCVDVSNEFRAIYLVSWSSVYLVVLLPIFISITIIFLFSSSIKIVSGCPVILLIVLFVYISQYFNFPIGTVVILENREGRSLIYI